MKICIHLREASDEIVKIEAEMSHDGSKTDAEVFRMWSQTIAGGVGIGTGDFFVPMANVAFVRRVETAAFVHDDNVVRLK